MRTVRAVKLLILILKCPCFVCLRASSPGHSGGGARKGSRACNCVCGLWIYFDAKCWFAEMTLLMTSFGTCLSMFVTFALVSASRWLAEIWQFSRPGPRGDLEVEFKFQRRICKLSFLFLSRRQSARSAYSQDIALSSAVTYLPNRTFNFHAYQRPKIKFHTTFQVFHGLYEPCVMLKKICYTSSFLVRLPSTLRP